MYLPKSASALIKAVIPNGWSAYVFGSMIRRREPVSSEGVGGRDIDILIVYPSHCVEQALQLRLAIFDQFEELGVFADIVLLNNREAAESRFAETEGAQLIS